MLWKTSRLNNVLNDNEIKIFIKCDFSAPCMTPYSRYNPTYRIYTMDGKYDGSTYQVIDFEEWIMNLTVANQPPYDPTVEQLYPSILKVHFFPHSMKSTESLGIRIYSQFAFGMEQYDKSVSFVVWEG